ncbi:hypothetical protein [Streptomyces sp. SID5770]|uniref:hypothetical protein n=1 Tax=unclassified Streptomyces TaxID=2593676 RepID=UPI0013720297|nr:hypothetical protein [Streptomyces sp. SID5770]MZE52719.1 hypothetical protein [Streptomyces sp. SID5770]
MSKTTAARTALRTAVASALIVLVTGVGAQASWADEPVDTTPAVSYGNGNGNGTDDSTGTGTTGTGTGTGTAGTAATTDNNPWD